MGSLTAGCVAPTGSGSSLLIDMAVAAQGVGMARAGAGRAAADSLAGTAARGAWATKLPRSTGLSTAASGPPEAGTNNNQSTCEARWFHNPASG